MGKRFIIGSRKVIRLVDKKIIILCIIILYVLSTIIVYLIAYFFNYDMGHVSILTKGYTLASVLLFLFYLFWEKIWTKLDSLEKLFPNLNGDWKITIHWRSINGQSGTVNGDCKITQTLFTLHIDIETNNSRSTTLFVTPEKKNGEIELGYIYINELNNSHPEAPKTYKGSAVLRISKNTQMLNGNYFTEQQNIGHFEIFRE
nr:hypothetical protein [Wohlfahrtiimonas chitiniclastica]